MSSDLHATRLQNTRLATPPPSPSPPPYHSAPAQNPATATRGRPIDEIDLRDAWNDAWIEPWRLWALCAATVVLFAVGAGVGWHFWKEK